MNKFLFFLLLLAAGCCKDKTPVKKCYTVIHVKVISFTPDRYLVTYARPRDTFKVETSSIYPVGYNTCTGFNWNTNFLIP
jgi:hypothetical protein